jgi:PhoH-like ATPase
MESSSAVRIDMPAQVEPASKIYVLDTNVLLHDPTAVTAFNEHHVVIPMTVLEELDHIKDRRDKTVSREARIAIQMIDRIVDAASPQAIQAGVPIPGAGERLATGTLAIYPDQLISDDSDVPYLDGTPDQANDNRIINVALKLQAENEAAFVCLVTKDINMRIKAKGSGLMHVEDYRRDRVLDDIDLLSKGYEHIAGDFWSTIDEVDTLREDDVTLHRCPAVPGAYPNMFLHDDHDFIAFVVRLDDEHVYLRCDSRDNLMNRRFWGLSPRNLEQAMAMSLLADRQRRHDRHDRPCGVRQDPAGPRLRPACDSRGGALQQADRRPLHAADRRGHRLPAGYGRGEDGAVAGGLRRQPRDSPR